MADLSWSYTTLSHRSFVRFTLLVEENREHLEAKCYCPLGVAMVGTGWEGYPGDARNPCPIDAAEHLDLQSSFTYGIADSWDGDTAFEAHDWTQPAYLAGRILGMLYRGQCPPDMPLLGAG